MSMEKIINNICWWIPNRKLRNSIRIFMEDIYNTKNDISYLKGLLLKRLSTENTIQACILKDMNFFFYDSILSTAMKTVSYDINNTYNFDNINFKEGDIVIDIGANIGMVSIFLAKKFPFLKIYSFEPSIENYKNFMKNIELNNIPDGIIYPHNLAVTKDNRNIDMIIPIEFPVGGASHEIRDFDSHIWHNYCLNIQSISIDNIFKKYNIEKCKLLKIDCEGSEFEILYNTSPDNLKKCEYMRGEFHGTEKQNNDLFLHCSKYIQYPEYKHLDLTQYFNKL